jgi:hypothetical protein
MKIMLSTVAALLLAATFVAVGSASQTCDFHVSPVQIELDGSAQSGFVNIETQPGCAWTVDSSVAWIHVGTAGGSGGGIIPYQVDTVPASTPLRQGIVRVRWNTPTAGQNVYVTQTTGPCTAGFFPAPGPTSARTFGWRGGSGDFWVLADPPFSGPWRITGSPSWITFISPPLGLVRGGDGDAVFLTAPNPSTSPRDGTVTFCSGQTIDVHQAGRSLKSGAAVPADFDGDGIADLVVYRPSSGIYYALLSSAGYTDYFGASWGTPGTVPMPGDFDGDNTTDLAVYQPNGLFGSAPAGNWNILYSSNRYSTATATSYAFPYSAFNYTPQNVPLMADFNGDGRSDFVTWRPDTAEWGVQTTDPRIATRLPENFLGGGEYNGHWQWGLSGDVPVPADFDGDRLADLAVWRPSTGTWFIRLSSEDYNRTTARAYQWGLPGDRPIAGDFDGDGRADLAVWRPSDGAWYVVSSSTGFNPAAMLRVQWGAPGDEPVANDYDGDGRTDLAVWRPSNGTWYLLLSSQQYAYGAARAYQWGLPGDVPLSGRIIGSQ